MINSEYYYENTAGIILSDKGRKVIRNILKDNKINCLVCGVGMVLISMNDGDSICCPMDMYGHKNGFSVKFDSKYTKKPSVLLVENES